jgi:hypothetical protein
MSSMRVKIISHVRRVTIPAALLLTILAVAGVPAPAAGQTTGSTGTVQDPPPVSCITDSPVDPLGPGYLLDRGEFATIDHPKAGLETAPYGINNQGQIVGGYDGPGFIFHGFLLDRGRYSTFDLPGASKTTGLRINDRGQILGLYEDARGGCHGFLLDQGRYTTIDFPGAPTQTLGLNDHGDVVGTYVDIDGETRRNVAFMRDKDGYSPIPIPGALQSAAFDINDQGQVLGAYLDKDGTSRYLSSARVTSRSSMCLERCSSCPSASTTADTSWASTSTPISSATASFSRTARLPRSITRSLPWTARPTTSTIEGRSSVCTSRPGRATPLPQMWRARPTRSACPAGLQSKCGKECRNDPAKLNAHPSSSHRRRRSIRHLAGAGSVSASGATAEDPPPLSCIVDEPTDPLGPG